jgi:hypothetical protein
VRPDGNAGHYEFREIDVARVRLIQELRNELQINEAALPIVLSLLDQSMTCAAGCASLEPGWAAQSRKTYAKRWLRIYPNPGRDQKITLGNFRACFERLPVS